MSSSKKEDELSASISKSMTVDKLQKSLKKANVDHSGLKKAALVSLFISNRLYEDSRPIQKEEEIERPIQKEEEEEITTKAKQELIMSFTISGHGCEDILNPWPDELPISQYFRNNVRVYSKSCVPDVNSIGSITGNINVLKKIQRKFADVPKAETSAIISAYADEVRDEYKDEILYAKTHKTALSLNNGFAKLSMPENMDRMSNLITFLANKSFGFYENNPNEKLTENYQIQQYKGLGIQVTDIRLKITNPDGTVSYSQIFSPISFERSDVSNFNLIYKEGMTYIVKDILKRKDLVKPALQIFGFTGKKDRIMDITLEQIYELIRLLNVDYVNIMDFTCRACSIGRIPQSLTNDIYNREQQYSVKPVAFGKRSKGKRLKGKRLTRKRGKNVAK